MTEEGKAIPENFRELDLGGLLTTAQIAKGFGKTSMTIYTWRKEKGMPYVVIKSNKKDAVRFDANEVAKWAKNSGITFSIDEALKQEDSKTDKLAS